MFNAAALSLILLIHLVPFGIGKFLPIDIEYELYTVSLLGIMLLQNIVIFKSALLGNRYTMLVAMLLVVASLWFLCEYIFILEVGKVTEQGLLING